MIIELTFEGIIMTDDLTSSQKAVSTKVVTIREVNVDLFDLFVSLTKAWGKNTGEVFSTIINQYQTGELSNVFLAPVKRYFADHSKNKIEYIDNLSELKITQDQLTSVNETIKFVFRNIKHLEFTDGINDQLILTHILRIQNCESIVAKDISKLVLSSLTRGKIPLKAISKQKKDVTIRNVSEELYQNFVGICRMLNKKVGEVVDDILLTVIPEMELTQILIGKYPELLNNILVISGRKNFQVTQKDLTEIGARLVLFHRIENLTFENVIDTEVFSDKIIAIYNCDVVSLPANIPKLLALAKLKQYPSK